jgi:hypothetical protein
VKNFPIVVKFLTILSVFGVFVIAAIFEMTARMRGLAAGRAARSAAADPGGLMADDATLKPAMLGRFFHQESFFNGALHRAASVLPARATALCVCGRQHSIVSTNQPI